MGTRRDLHRAERVVGLERLGRLPVHRHRPPLGPGVGQDDDGRARAFGEDLNPVGKLGRDRRRSCHLAVGQVGGRVVDEDLGAGVERGIAQASEPFRLVGREHRPPWDEGPRQGPGVGVDISAGQLDRRLAELGPGDRRDEEADREQVKQGRGAARELPGDRVRRPDVAAHRQDQLDERVGVHRVVAPDVAQAVHHRQVGRERPEEAADPAVAGAVDQEPAEGALGIERGRVDLGVQPVRRRQQLAEREQPQPDRRGWPGGRDQQPGQEPQQPRARDHRRPDQVVAEPGPGRRRDRPAKDLGDQPRRQQAEQDHGGEPGGDQYAPRSTARPIAQGIEPPAAQDQDGPAGEEQPPAVGREVERRHMVPPPEPGYPEHRRREPDGHEQPEPGLRPPPAGRQGDGDQQQEDHPHEAVRAALVEAGRGQGPTAGLLGASQQGEGQADRLPEEGLARVISLRLLLLAEPQTMARPDVFQRRQDLRRPQGQPQDQGQCRGPGNSQRLSLPDPPPGVRQPRPEAVDPHPEEDMGRCLQVPRDQHQPDHDGQSRPAPPLRPAEQGGDAPHPARQPDGRRAQREVQPDRQVTRHREAPAAYQRRPGSEADRPEESERPDPRHQGLHQLDPGQGPGARPEIIDRRERREYRRLHVGQERAPAVGMGVPGGQAARADLAGREVEPGVEHLDRVHHDVLGHGDPRRADHIQLARGDQQVGRREQRPADQARPVEPGLPAQDARQQQGPGQSAGLEG